MIFSIIRRKTVSWLSLWRSFSTFWRWLRLLKIIRYRDVNTSGWFRRTVILWMISFYRSRNGYIMTCYTDSWKFLFLMRFRICFCYCCHTSIGSWITVIIFTLWYRWNILLGWHTRRWWHSWRSWHSRGSHARRLHTWRSHARRSNTRRLHPRRDHTWRQHARRLWPDTLGSIIGWRRF